VKLWAELNKIILLSVMQAMVIYCGSLQDEKVKKSEVQSLVYSFFLHASFIPSMFFISLSAKCRSSFVCIDELPTEVK